jgi:hypothetical protein
MSCGSTPLSVVARTFVSMTAAALLPRTDAELAVGDPRGDLHVGRLRVDRHCGALAEGERVGLDAGGGECDLEGAVGDGAALPDELV